MPRIGPAHALLRGPPAPPPTLSACRGHRRCGLFGWAAGTAIACMAAPLAGAAVGRSSNQVACVHHGLRLPRGQVFFAWYNNEHRHLGIGYMTPHSVHCGLAADMRVLRQATLDAAFLANPNRFKSRRPQLPPMPAAAWINPPPEEKKPAREPSAAH